VSGGDVGSIAKSLRLVCALAGAGATSGGVVPGQSLPLCRALTASFLGCGACKWLLASGAMKTVLLVWLGCAACWRVVARVLLAGRSNDAFLLQRARA